MSDHMKQRQQTEPRSQIDARKPDELRQWARTLNVSEERLKQTVEHVGPSVGTVRNALGR